VEDVFTPGLAKKSPGLPTNSPAHSGNTAREREDKAAAQSESQLATSPTFAQVNNPLWFDTDQLATAFTCVVTV
jgi:hypothetical protein